MDDAQLKNLINYKNINFHMKSVTHKFLYYFDSNQFTYSLFSNLW